MVGLNRRFLVAFALSCLGMLTLAAAINYRMDPGGLWGSERARQVARLLLEGKNIRFTSLGINDRQINRYYIHGLHEASDVVVFGSSNSWEVRQVLFPGKSFYNHASSVSTLEDFVAYYGMYHQRSLKPEQIVIGVNPWILNRFNGLVNWKFVRGDFLYLASLLDIPTDLQRHPISLGSNKYLELISLGYFRESLPALIRSLWNTAEQSEYGQTLNEEPDGEYSVYRHDGTIALEHSWRNPTPEQVLASAISMVQPGPPTGLAKFTLLDPDRIRALEAFLRFLTENEGIEVTLFLPPYHPTTYDLLMEHDYGIVAETENYLRRMATSLGIQVAGSFDPSSSDCRATEFYDGRHPKASCVLKIFSMLAPEG